MPIRLLVVDDEVDFLESIVMRIELRGVTAPALPLGPDLPVLGLGPCGLEVVLEFFIDKKPGAYAIETLSGSYLAARHAAQTSDVAAAARHYGSALRRDPDVILVGEMRDLETIEAAITAGAVAANALVAAAAGGSTLAVRVPAHRRLRRLRRRSGGCRRSSAGNRHRDTLDDRDAGNARARRRARRGSRWQRDRAQVSR